MALRERKVENIAWNTRGTVVAGYLLDVVRTRFKDGIGITYVVQRADGSRGIFKGSTMLNLALGPSDKGLFIEVEYLGEDGTREVREGFNPAKLFRVSVDNERSIQVNPQGDPGIQDDDVPF